jgi:hypothetical protein
MTFENSDGKKKFCNVRVVVTPVPSIGVPEAVPESSDAIDQSANALTAIEQALGALWIMLDEGAFSL